MTQRYRAPVLVAAAAGVAIVMPTEAFAYFGPGAGLSLLGALWALLLAIGTALFFVLAWPVRKALRRRRAARAAAAGDAAAGDTAARPDR